MLYLVLGAILGVVLVSVTFRRGKCEPKRLNYPAGGWQSQKSNMALKLDSVASSISIHFQILLIEEELPNCLPVDSSSPIPEQRVRARQWLPSREPHFQPMPLRVWPCDKQQQMCFVSEADMPSPNSLSPSIGLCWAPGVFGRHLKEMAELLSPGP